MSYLRLWVGRGCGHSEPASYEFRCAAGLHSRATVLRLLRHEYLMNAYWYTVRYRRYLRY